MWRLSSRRCRCAARLGPPHRGLTHEVEARRRCADLPGVRFEQMFVPEPWPGGVFDRVLLSEVVYSFSREDVGSIATSVSHSLAPDGPVILVRWTGSTDYPLSGDEAVALFIERMGSACVVMRADRYAEFRLCVLSRA
jgi:hypothetical protein